jgi:hypothetical protein
VLSTLHMAVGLPSDGVIEAFLSSIQIDINQKVHFISSTTDQVFEEYNINSIRVLQKLGKFEVVKNTLKLTFKPEPGVEMNFVQRRSDFQGVTVKAMVEDQTGYLMFSPNFEAIGTIFIICPSCPFKYLIILVIFVATYFPDNKTYDVTGFTFGLYKEVLSILETELNFTTRQYKRQDGAWGSVTVDPSTRMLLSSGMINDVISGNADIIAASISMQIERSLAVDFLPPISSDHAALIILNEETFDDLVFDTYNHPLSNQLWLVIVIVASCISIFLYLYKFIITGINFKTVSSSKNVITSSPHFCIISRGWSTLPAFYGQV